LDSSDDTSLLAGDTNGDLHRYAISGRSHVLGERYLVTKKGEKEHKYDSLEGAQFWCDGVDNFLRNLRSVVEGVEVDFNFFKDGNPHMLLPEMSLFLHILRISIKKNLTMGGTILMTNMIAFLQLAVVIT